MADFFHLAPLEAAKKLAEDFGIPVFTDSSKKRNTSKEKEKPKRTLYQTEKKFEEWKRESIRILSDYLHLLKEWKVNYAPKTLEEEWKAEFIEACQQTEKINYYLDLLERIHSQQYSLRTMFFRRILALLLISHPPFSNQSLSVFPPIC